MSGATRSPRPAYLPPHPVARSVPARTRPRTARIAAALAVLLVAMGCVALRPDRALVAATGVVAHDLCSEAFVSAQDAETAYTESLAPRTGFWVIGWAMRHSVDAARHEVRASMGGVFESRAVWRAGRGCMLASRGAAPGAGELPALAPLAPRPPGPALLPEIAGPAVVAPVDGGLKSALDAAFGEVAGGRQRATKAVVIVRDGKVVAERYADGYGTETPILAFSMSKSVINALVGILVQQGRLDVHGPAPVPAWQASDDPRHAISIEQLMRMTSGLDLDETGSGFDPSNQMFYGEPDMAAFAERATLRAEPGTRWYYSSAGVHILSRIVRDQVGGTEEAVRRFMSESLFEPLGMRDMTVESDATGTPIGAHYMLGSARDWARFGSLFLDDGIVGGRRLLPADWIRFSTTPTLATDYGAGWWPNRTSNPNGARTSKLDMPLMTGVPADTFYALGNLGQYLAVIPSERLVIVRMGRSHEKDFGVRGFNDLVRATVAAQRQGAR